ncbi:MAG: MlaE family lipid ABC transporter permease subunit [Rhodanobacter sp.]
MTASAPTFAELDIAATPACLRVRGAWTLPHYQALERELLPLRGHIGADTVINLDGVDALDTAGAALMVHLLGAARLQDLALEAAQWPPARRALLETVGAAMQEYRRQPRPKPPNTALLLLERVGTAVDNFYRQALQLLGFIGLTLQTLARGFFHPRRWRITALVAHVEQTGLDAVPIVALLSFLVGAVVAFLGATVLADFGATIFTVDLVAFSFLREFGVLLTAILLAGRSASAFTAQIGSMKAREEIDAIRTLGLDPMELLVLPRVLALLIALPLLSFLAMLAGIFGGAMVCVFALDITPSMFLSMLHSDTGVRHFLVGLSKAPVFAFLIAVIGCLEGFRVSGSAQSVGEHTTSSVVQSIFVVIVIDAIAALFFMEIGW